MGGEGSLVLPGLGSSFLEQRLDLSGDSPPWLSVGFTFVLDSTWLLVRFVKYCYLGPISKKSGSFVLG